MDKVQMPQGQRPPQMLVYKTSIGKLLIFKSGKCRLMGCKKPITNIDLPITDLQIQSVTATMDLGVKLDLPLLATRLTSSNCVYEPELFPALRLTRSFNPLCVNVFASGKVVILGLKTLDIKPTCIKVANCLNVF